MRVKCAFRAGDAVCLGLTQNPNKRAGQVNPSRQTAASHKAPGTGANRAHKAMKPVNSIVLRISVSSRLITTQCVALMYKPYGRFKKGV